MTDTNKNVIIVLHEIYGINDFIKSQCLMFKHMGYDVSCPDLLNRKSFKYDEVKEAYAYFMLNVGFDYYHEINRMIDQLKTRYEKVLVIGYSVGATLAWRCSENLNCDGIIACYGSRIRDFTELDPRCPVLLLPAKECTFDINKMIEKLQDKANLKIISFNAEHGFLDAASSSYDKYLSESAEKYILKFITDCCKS